MYQNDNQLVIQLLLYPPQERLDRVRCQTLISYKNYNNSYIHTNI